MTKTQTPYFYFKNDSEIISRIKSENEGASNEVIKKAIKTLWKSMEIDTREKWITMSNKGPEALDDDEKVEPEKVEPEKVETEKVETEKVVPENSILKKRRPKTSYMQFVNDPEVNAEMLKEDPTLKGKARISYLAEKWRSLTDEEKKPYEDKYHVEKESLEKQPQWVEKPQAVKKPRSPKNMSNSISPSLLDCLTRDVKKLQEDVKVLKEMVSILQSN